MASPSNRGGPTFFTSFFSAFRTGQKYYPPAQPKSPASTSSTASAAVGASSVTTKANSSSANWDNAPTSDASSFESLRSAPMSFPTAVQRHARATTPGTSPIGLSIPRSPTPTGSGGTFQHQSRTPSATRGGARRGSDSSYDGGGKSAFRDSIGPQTWYIGGRTATGEEKYYKLGMVKRYNSQDRLSLDRLSL